MATVDQRVVDLAYAGHELPEITSLLGVQPNHVRDLLRDLSKAPAGGVAPTSLLQRAIDLAYAGQQLPEISDLTGLAENDIRDALQATTATPVSRPRSGFHASDYGVLADGVTDDWPALQALLLIVRALSANSRNGYRVWLPSGLIALSKTLIVPTQTKVQGQGMYASTLKIMAGANCDVVQFEQFNSASQAAVLASLAGAPTQANLRNAFYSALEDLTVHGNSSQQAVTSYNHAVNATPNPLTGTTGTDPDFDPQNRLINVQMRAATGDGFFANGRSGLVASGCIASHNLGNGFTSSFDTEWDHCQAGFNGVAGFFLNHQSIQGAGCKSYNNGQAQQWVSGMNSSVGQRVMSAGVLYAAITAQVNDTVAPASDPTNWAALAASSPAAWGAGVHIDAGGGEITFDCDSQQNSGNAFYCGTQVGAVRLSGAANEPNYSQVGGVINATNPNHYSALMVSSNRGLIANIAANVLGAAGTAFAKYGVGSLSEIHITGDSSGAALAANSASLVGIGAVWYNGALLSPVLTFPSGNSLWIASGAPAVSNPVLGDYYLRTDTPTVANQRIYVCTTGGGAPVWLALL